MTKQNDSAAADTAQLTAREREVMALVCAGLTSAGIGEALGISYRTVEIHRYNSGKKLGAKNAVHAAVLFWEMAKWKPIESAPKDGAGFLVDCDQVESGVSMMFWHNGGLVSLFDGKPWHDWMAPPKWWMPFPVAPQKES